MAGRQALNKRARRRIDDAVRSAEERTGLQLCVYFGPTGEDPRAHAESLFVRAGFRERPGVLVMVAPGRRRVEIVTAPEVRERLSDEGCARAIGAMTPMFAEGRYVDGLVLGVEILADEAGPGSSVATELPNILGE